MEAIEKYAGESDMLEMDLPIPERRYIPLARWLPPSCESGSHMGTATSDLPNTTSWSICRCWVGKALISTLKWYEFESSEIWAEALRSMCMFDYP